MSRVAILQSNYIPWKGYFDIIRKVDVFVYYDDVQFTKRDWRNRNRIKTKDGLLWLTIPVETKGRFNQKIKDVKISGSDWQKKHWQSISHSYASAPYFREYSRQFEELYLNKTYVFLCEVNYSFISVINDILGLKTRMVENISVNENLDRTEKLIDICQKFGAHTYLSGPAARTYLDEQQFKARSIQVEWMDYSHYPQHRQLFGPFEHAVSILDLIFNEGPNARNYLLPRSCTS